MSKKGAVLICDDSITSRKNLKRTIISKGDYTILEASDGQMAVELYKSNMPDLVFMDIVMPVKDGLLATKEIRAFDKNARIVILSSVGTKENLKEALTCGVLDFIQKPWDEKHIESMLSKLI